MRGHPITVCIPTAGSPQRLREAVESCFAQDHRPLEILVADHSGGRECRAAVKALDLPEGVKLRHKRFWRPVSEARAIGWLARHVRTPYFVLLRGTGAFVPGGLDELIHRLDVAESYRRAPLVMYGRAEGAEVGAAEAVAGNGLLVWTAAARREGIGESLFASKGRDDIQPLDIVTLRA